MSHPHCRDSAIRNLLPLSQIAFQATIVVLLSDCLDSNSMSTSELVSKERLSSTSGFYRIPVIVHCLRTSKGSSSRDCVVGIQFLTVCYCRTMAMMAAQLPKWCSASGPDPFQLENGNAEKFLVRQKSMQLGLKCCAKAAEAVDMVESRKKTVLVMGGTGRVGASTLRALAKGDDLHLIVGGRNREKGEALARDLGGNAEFSGFELDDPTALRAAINGADLVVHAAGPFQRRAECAVLEAAIDTKTAYIDVCDDQDYSVRAKAYHDRAVAAQIPAITTAGIYPGVSNIMAAELVRLNGKPKRIRYSYYTAGSGGAGPTILATSFLLLGEETIVFVDGKEQRLKAYSARRVVDFGRGIGKKPVYLLNLPEVRSTYEVLKAPSVSARFGTSPQIWNVAMGLVATFVPKEILQDQKKVQSLVKWSDIAVRAVDSIAGERVSMRVDLECENGKKAIGIFSHKMLSVSVGVSVAAFARAVLDGATQPGVWFPEEEEGIAESARRKLLERAAEGTINFVMNKSPWMTNKDPKEIGFGLYW